MFYIIIDGPHKVTYQIPYDAECNWQETGKMWYDIYGKLLKVCHSGTWRLAQLPSDQGWFYRPPMSSLVTQAF